MFKKSSTARALKPSESQQLLQFSLSYCGYGPLYWEYKEKELRMKETYLEKFKDKDLSQAEDQFISDVKIVQDWANKTLPGLLKQELTFESETFKKSGPLFLYASSVFEFENSKKRLSIARDSLISAIQNNIKEQQSMMQICIKNSYIAHDNIAYHYFLTISKAVMAKGYDITYSLMSVLCLCFYKMTDPLLSIRKEAANLLDWLSTRFFRTHLFILYHHSSSQSLNNSFNQLVCIV